jgi:hypothetical protein
MGFPVRISSIITDTLDTFLHEVRKEEEAIAVRDVYCSVVIMKLLLSVRFEVFTAVTIKNFVFWDMIA